MKLIDRINPVWLYRVVRIGFGAIFATVGFLYEDAWPAYLFAAIFFITAFMRPRRCVEDQCSTNDR